MIRLSNTLTGKKEELQPLKPPQVTMYVCGITVYDVCHIGHARGGIVFDMLRRFLERQGLKVRHIRNITDVDDKIINRAREEGGDLKAATLAVSSKYTESYRRDYGRLGLLAPELEPKATEYIPKMVAYIEDLMKRGMAYETSDGVYFVVRKLPEYGRLSHQKPDQMLENAKMETGQGKKDPLDFALWKKAKPEEPSWPSPWGEGRPGWHIECTTMSTHLLGDQFDIHGGGQDLTFPHHENELAQAAGASKPFAKLWMHNGLLTVNGQKMSKSLGNFVTLDEALKKHPADVIRMFFLSAHYHSPLDFTWERLDEAARAYERWTGFIAHAQLRPSESGASLDGITRIESEFVAAMQDDLNTPRAVASLHELTTSPAPKAAAAKLKELAGLLGFFQASEPADPEAERLAKERDAARKNKDFATSDRIRKQLTEMGYVVEDTAGGTVVRKQV